VPLERSSDGGFLAVSTLLFVVSAAATVAWCTSMPAMGEVPMPGGWTMSMVWMRMPGQTWSAVVTSFLGMWTVMMAAMMLPSIVPVLWRYRRTVVEEGKTHPDRLTTLVGLGYFLVWTLFGAAVFPLGAALSAVAIGEPALARAVPILVGAIVLIAGAVQLRTSSLRRSAYRRRQRETGRALSARALTSLRHGVRLGVRCGQCCAAPMIVLLGIGIMNLGVMAVVTAAITAQRLAPPHMRVGQIVGTGTVAIGLVLTTRALGLG
jgi:predicted metal-binding membrane protein